MKSFLIKAILLAVIMILPSLSAGGEAYSSDEYTDKPEAERIFELGNQNYIEENYMAAIEHYERVIDAGFESACLFYNLGNAYFQEGMLGMAILNYERAILIDPTDADTRHNLRIARSYITEAIEPLPRLFFHDWHDRMLGLQSSDAWARTLVGLILLFCCSVVVFLVSQSTLYRKAGFFAALILLAFSAISYYSARTQYSRQFEQDKVVITREYATARSAPTRSSVELFRIYEGNKARLTDQIGEWCELRLPDGNRCWVECSVIEVI